MARSKVQKPPAPTQPFTPDPPVEELGDDLFSRQFKPWREWHTAVDFLTNLHIGVDDAQVFCSPQDPPDVIYQDAAFEIKEIMDEGRRRHDEVKQARQKAIRQPISHDYTSRSVIDLLPEDAGQLVLAQLEVLAGRYQSEVRAHTDMLFYVNKRDHWFDDGPMPSSALFVRYGWRSVSAVVASSVSLVFYASASAPKFLQDNCGKVRKRHERLIVDA
ncbi:DUF1780 domain-containing protein [Diaphorobacter ruginosibacter]|uniref:DUF1780 domain-containing protein n=1 Tax=Diaphorobacter ruginosibacter TaxID=1715720 RepID=A0A7G9RMS9_9BURK|nr:DUF1780 domain-containing protein [Diaphorobacter ruginosibacter]QNN56904.1 DUF1780 domain-containing protein [Diaphorobacter ruginosibacter]